LGHEEPPGSLLGRKDTPRFPGGEDIAMSDKKCTLCDAVKMFKEKGMSQEEALAKGVKWFYGEKNDAKPTDIQGKTR
jgi:hypothetical protein